MALKSAPVPVGTGRDLTIPCDCGNKAKLVTGADVFPYKPELSSFNYYLCECGNYTPCVMLSTIPLGSPINHLWYKRAELKHTIYRSAISQRKVGNGEFLYLLCSHMQIPIQFFNVDTMDLGTIEQLMLFIRKFNDLIKVKAKCLDELITCLWSDYTPGKEYIPNKGWQDIFNNLYPSTSIN